MTANFGGKPKSANLDKVMSTRIIVSTCLLTGTVLWIGYRASVTSELFVKKINYPFDSLESLLESGFTYVSYWLNTNKIIMNTPMVISVYSRLGTNERGSVTEQLFASSKKGSIYWKLYNRAMHSNKSFTRPNVGLGHVVDTTSFAYIEDIQLILAQSQYDCKVSSCH